MALPRGCWYFDLTLIDSLSSNLPGTFTLLDCTIGTSYKSTACMGVDVQIGNISMHCLLNYLGMETFDWSLPENIGMLFKLSYPHVVSLCYDQPRKNLYALVSELLTRSCNGAQPNNVSTKWATCKSGTWIGFLTIVICSTHLETSKFGTGIRSRPNNISMLYQPTYLQVGN